MRLLWLLGELLETLYVLSSDIMVEVLSGVKEFLKYAEFEFAATNI